MPRRDGRTPHRCRDARRRACDRACRSRVWLIRRSGRAAGRTRLGRACRAASRSLRRVRVRGIPAGLAGGCPRRRIRADTRARTRRSAPSRAVRRPCSQPSGTSRPKRMPVLRRIRIDTLSIFSRGGRFRRHDAPLRRDSRNRHPPCGFHPLLAHPLMAGEQDFRPVAGVVFAVQSDLRVREEQPVVEQRRLPAVDEPARLRTLVIRHDAVHPGGASEVAGPCDRIGCGARVGRRRVRRVCGVERA